MPSDSSSVRDRFRVPAHATMGRAPRGDRGAATLLAATLQSRIPARAATRAAAAGARTGIGVATMVAAWAGLRLALDGAVPPEVVPLAEALAWSREPSEPSRGAAGWAPTVAPSMTLLASHLASATLVGALASTATASAALRPRLALLLALLGAECALWQLAAWHAGPWLRATVWYHSVTAVLTVIVVLERIVVAMPQLRSPLPRARSGVAPSHG